MLESKDWNCLATSQEHQLKRKPVPSAYIRKSSRSRNPINTRHPELGVAPIMSLFTLSHSLRYQPLHTGRFAWSALQPSERNQVSFWSLLPPIPAPLNISPWISRPATHSIDPFQYDVLNYSKSRTVQKTQMSSEESEVQYNRGKTILKSRCHASIDSSEHYIGVCDR